MTIVRLENTKTLGSKRSSSNILKMFFVILQIIFGYDFGFIKYKSTTHKIIIKIIIAVLNIVSGFTYFILALPDLDFMDKIWSVILILTSCSILLTLLLTPEKNTFQKFMNHLLWIDSELDVYNSYYCFEFSIVLSCTLLILLETWLDIVSVQFYSSLYAQILRFFIFVPIRIPFVVLFFVFRATNGKLAALENLLNNEPKKAQILYKSLIDSVENFKQSFNYIFLVTVSANIPSTMTLVYRIVRDLKTTGFNFYINSVNVIAAVIFLSTLFVPALAAETLPNEARRLTIALQDLLISENDEGRIQDIKRFIRYIAARPFKLTVLRIIPLDASFVVMSLSFSVTYLIVILQLTHIY